MEAEFWHQRWQQQQIGFHQQQVHPLLSRYWQDLHLPNSARVLVPLCGKSLDMLWLLGQGHSLVGVELSELAVQTFFSENGLQPSVCLQGGLDGFSVGDLTILCGDFFGLHVKPGQRFDAIYDRAALIALPPSMRDSYIDKLVSLLRPDGQVLLVTLEFPPEERQGPPFSIPDDEVMARFSSRFSIEKLESETLTAESAGSSRRGLLGAQEAVYRLRHKSD
ncbi:MAG: thiopurine S-methyltransferase [Halopseudomonas sp.]